MKRFAVILIAAACMTSLTACGSGKPDLEEVEKAIAEGNVTIEDAFEKGWVSQEWVDAYYDENAVDAANKSEVYSLGEFSAQTISGETYTSDDLAGVTYFAFFDPSNAEDYFRKLCDANDAVEKNGGKILAFSMSEIETDVFKDAPFQILFYNDSVGKALPDGTDEFIKEIVNELYFTGSWFADGYFQTAWNSAVDEEELAQTAKNLTDDLAGKDDSNEEDDQAAAAIGEIK